MRLRGRYQRLVLGHPAVAFGVLVLSFLAFGLLTLNLLFVLRANLELLADHGWQAVMDGGGAQLLEVVASAVAGLGAYIVFKSCEHRLVHWLTHEESE